MVARCLGALLAVVLLDCAAALRTGIAPTYIPTMRQKTSYETNNINTFNDVIVELRQWEKEQKETSKANHLTEGHRVAEAWHNTQLRTENAILRSTLTARKNAKLYNDDQSYREFDRNKGLEPQNVALTVVKTTQDNYIFQTNKTNRILNAHAIATQNLNNLLNAEKKTVWLDLEAQERKEWFARENSIAVEVQNPSETKSKEYHIEQTNLLNSHVSDMTTRTNMLKALVPGLTTDRDAQETAKKRNIVDKRDMEFQAWNVEVQVPSLLKQKSALEKLVMQYQMANSDLVNYNAKLSSEITTLAAERDALRTNFEEQTNTRNAAQIKADHYEVLFTDMKRKHNDASFARFRAFLMNDGTTKGESVCWARNAVLKNEEANLRAVNKNLRDNCY